MRRKIWLAFFLACSTLAQAQEPPSTLQQKLTQAQAGDYMVTAQEGNYSLLCIRSVTADTLLLEEISVPERQIDLKKIDWKKWVTNKAPGHTSWTLYEIDQKTNALIECFSYSKNGWLYLDPAEQFLTRLLTLPLEAVSENGRKKIGPKPAHTEDDHRSLWSPSVIIEGKKISKPTFEVLKTQWPDDGSRLALCSIELYFNKEFPFPYWIEVQSPHYAFKMRTVDSGHSLVSPMAGPMPHRPLQIVGLALRGADLWTLKIQAPSYFHRLHLFAIDLSKEAKTTIPIPCIVKKSQRNEEKILEIPTSDLDRLLTHGNRYRWVVIPEGTRNIYVESEEAFTW